MSEQHRVCLKNTSWLLVLLAALITSAALGDDWPMWRNDPARRGASEEELAETLHLQWVLELPTPAPAWPSSQDRLRFDRLYEPVLKGETLFIASTVSDKVTAYATDSGEERWVFYAGGPIRFAPVAWKDRLFFTSDDGYLYCLNSSDGSLVWKFLGGPTERKVLGNDRLVSAWPARGGPVVYGGVVYFGASIWPFMGVFIHALDAETGRVVWTNSSMGSRYTTQQHDSPAFAGVAPQGYFAATEDYLLVAGGRTVPAVLDRRSGKLLFFNVSSRSMGTKGGGGYEVTCGNNFFLNGGKVYRLDNGKFLGSLDGSIVTEYAAIARSKEGIQAYKPRWEEVEAKDRKGATVKKQVVKKTWSVPVDRKLRRVFIVSGSRLYASGEGGTLLAVDLCHLERGAHISWSTKIPDEPLNMIVGDGRLIVTTDRGRIYCYGEEERSAELPAAEVVSIVVRGSAWGFLDDGSDQGTEWRSPDFDDSQWASGPGPLGYGERDEATKLSFGSDDKKKPITCYFRHVFRVEKPGDYRDLRLLARVDDGAVVYLNGEEVARFFMPEGEITATTLAKSAREANDYTEAVLTGDGLRPGMNVLAVEIHQANRTSSDLKFDLELSALHEGFRTSPSVTTEPDVWTATAADILENTAATDGGYCLVLGIGSGRLAEEIASQARCHVICIDPDADKVDAFRRRIDELDLYGTRIAAVVGDPLTMKLPPYVAELVVAEDPSAVGVDRGEGFLRSVFRVLRPFTGVACFVRSRAEYANIAAAVEAAHLDKATIRRSGDLAVLGRFDAPTGSGDWTHQYGDAGNRVVSGDTLVKSPMGLLWFGGPSNEGILPRHGHGPTPQVAGGRLFIEGRDLLRAVDIYTGRLLWERVLKDVGRSYDYTGHEPGANAVGSNYVSLTDGVYVVHEKRCLRLDPRTGKTISEFRLPASAGEKEPPDWGYIGVWNRFLIAGARPIDFSPPDFRDRDIGGLKEDALKKAFGAIRALKDFQPTPRRRDKKDDKDERLKNDRAYVLANLNKLLADEDLTAKIPSRVRFRADAEALEKKLREYLKTPGRKPTDHEAMAIKRELLHRYYSLPKYEKKPAGKFGSLLRTGSRKLVAMDRYEGNVLWEREANHQIRHNAIALGAGTVFYIERMSDVEANYYRRRGLPVNENASVTALDIERGDALWSTSERVFGTWLGYSEEHDVLLQAGSQARDRARDEVGKGMVAYRGKTGEVLWQNDDTYSGPCLLLGDQVITQGYGTPGFALGLLTGEVQRRRHPVSGELTPWQYTRNYGCNTAVGSPNLLTFRSAAAGFYDLASDGGTGNFGGFRSGCTSNLIPAGGILNAPDYTRTCTCAYQNQTSLGLVHMPEIETWTFSPYRHDGKPVRKIGLNFGAPGDRRGPDGTLWLDFPSVGGHSPDIPVEVLARDPAYRRGHESLVSGRELNWVAASAFEGSGEIAMQLLSPEEVVSSNELTGQSSLSAANATVSAAVFSREVPATGRRNWTSLKGSGDGKMEAIVSGCNKLAAPSLTVEFWSRVDSDVDFVDARATGTDNQQGFVIDNRQLRLRYFVANDQGDDNRPEVTITSDGKIPDNTWVYVAFTYDAATGVGTLYRDGEVVGRHDGPDGVPLWWDSRSPDLLIGKGAGQHCYFDELRVSDAALEPHELLYSPPVSRRDEGVAGGDGGASPVKTGNVVGYWRMESGPTPGGSRARKLGSLYTVRLIFAERDGLKTAERVFDVWLQEKLVLPDFDIARISGGPYRVVIREFQDVFVLDHLRIRLESKRGAPPLLSGVQVIRRSGSF